MAVDGASVPLALSKILLKLGVASPTTAPVKAGLLKIIKKCPFHYSRILSVLRQHLGYQAVMYLLGEYHPNIKCYNS